MSETTFSPDTDGCGRVAITFPSETGSDRIEVPYHKAPPDVSSTEGLQSGFSPAKYKPAKHFPLSPELFQPRVMSLPRQIFELYPASSVRVQDNGAGPVKYGTTGEP